TCAPTSKTVADIVEENWLQVSFRVKAGQAVERIDTRLVLDIKRTAEDAQTTAYRAAVSELESGSADAARAGFASVAGGGRTIDPGPGKADYKPFPAEAGRAKWYVGYAIYHYALASYREGVAKGEKQLLEDALRALDADSGEEKGYLARYKEGKNRWYADALLLKAQILLALDRADQAAAAFDALYQKAITSPIGAKFAYEAKLGPGRVAEAKKDLNAAEAAYEAATAAVQSLLEQAADACTRRDFGRFYNEARMEKARVMREAAEKDGSAAAFGRLRAFLQQGTPEALRAKLAGKPPELVDAVMAGALAPTVQAVAQNGIGLAFLAEKKYAEAVFAFTQVRVKYFSVAAEVPRALYYLAKAADAAAGAAAKPEAKTLYQAQAKGARDELQKDWRGSSWATKAP
ncbi:MAG: hypothetical protein JNM10_15895, partial [Planctomycetia bacterium]|nr:hypothetical protein [Planctomycetia bacterium]